MNVAVFTWLFSGHVNAKENTQQCIDCHQNQVSLWQQSDHAKAMAPADNHTVLGDFGNAQLDHFSQKVTFTLENKEYWVTLTHEGRSSKHKVEYTFGHFPLQQYLVETQQGRMQVLPYAWDSRNIKEGGQKWYPIYPDENIKHQDRLHWQQPLQNWNGMCADCHSDGLKRNYSIADNRFDTQWDNINVGCQSCHGKMDTHPQKATRPSEAKDIGQWVRDLQQTTAKWQGPPRDNGSMQSCFACHSLRSPVTDGFDTLRPYLDQFSPNFIAPPLYHVDGQIKEEVYVYGSFLQSKMFAQGVNCQDCHDPHSMKLKAENNAVCLQCHSPEVFNVTSHHRHTEGSEGSQCVNCHMPSTRYMGVDDRRDHSFKIPRPDLSIQYKTPNACTGCHEDKNDAWAAATLKQWHGLPAPLSATLHTFQELQSGRSVTITQHLALINDSTVSEIVRATAISHLPNTTQQLSNNAVKSWVMSETPLIRLALARNGQILAPADRLKSFSLLLDDKFQSIRVAAANHLLNAPVTEKSILDKAISELLKMNDVNSWRGEGNLNQSMLHLGMGNTAKAINALQRGIDVEPYFAENYINLADLYRISGETENEKQTFEHGLKTVPGSAMLHYSYGLHLIRSKQHNRAISSFSKALKIEPKNSQFAYVYILSLDGTGQTKRALSILKSVILRFKDSPQMVQLGMNLAQKLQDKKSFDYFNQYLN